MSELKNLYLGELKKDAVHPGWFVFSYKSLSPENSSGFRRELKKVGAGLVVGPNRLLKKALISDATAGINWGKGPVALLHVENGENIMAAAKTLYEFNKKAPAFGVSVFGGVLDGKVLDAEQVKALSLIPPKDQLRAQFIGLLTAAPAKLLAVLKAKAEKA